MTILAVACLCGHWPRHLSVVSVFVVVMLVMIPVASQEYFDVRLADGPRNSTGRVEVFFNGRWGTVCDYNFDAWETNAYVICKTLGYSGEKAEVIRAFGGGSGNIVLNELNCTGSETRLQDCSWRGKGGDNNGIGQYADHCRSNHLDVGVDCGGDFDVRLVGGSDRSKGRLETYIDGKWGTVCNDGFGVTEARVVCNWLGYTGTKATVTRKYVGGSGDILLDDLRCTGTEPSLRECSWNGKGSRDDGIGRHNCGHDNDAGVECQGDFQLRLVDGPRGRLEVYFNGRWGSVCRHKVYPGAAYARVVCRLLGYTGEKAEAIRADGTGSGDIFLYLKSCTGNETRLRDCSWFGKGGVNDGIGRHESCTQGHTIGVDCGESAATQTTTTADETNGEGTTLDPRTGSDILKPFPDVNTNAASDQITLVEDVLNQTAFQTNQTVVGEVVSYLSNLMEADINVLSHDDIAFRVLAGIEQVFRKGALSGGHLTASSPNLAIAVRAVDKQNFSGLTLTADAGDDGRFQEGEVQIDLDDNLDHETSGAISSLVLPASLLTSLNNVTRIATAVHFNGRIFEAMASSQPANKSASPQGDGTVRAVNSHIISASVVGCEKVTNLKDPVTIRFEHLNKNPANGRPECVFWEQSLNKWSPAGCQIVQEKSARDWTTCECDHLTNFALLMDVHRQGDKLPPEHGQILSLISYIGCGVSLLALTLTILTYCLCNPLASRSAGNESSFGSGGYRRTKRLSKPSTILVSLCLALALTDLVFVAGMQQYTLHSPDACKTAAILLHFCLLSSMCWMSVEAFHLYLAVVRVYKTRITRFILKASCFGWGVPLVVVVVTVGVNTTDNYASLNSGICWLTGVAFYVAFVAPVCLILLFNAISFLLVLRGILGLTNNKLNRTKSSETAQKLRRAVGVVILLGLTWVFGFLAIDDTSQLVFNYLFAIFNSLQGLFIFLFYCVFNKDVRAAYKRCFRCCKSIRCCKNRPALPCSSCRTLEETHSEDHVLSEMGTKDKTILLKNSTAETSLSTATVACTSTCGEAFSALG